MKRTRSKPDPSARGLLGRFLSRISPFDTLDPDVGLRRLTAVARLETFRPGARIYGEGDPADSVWVVRSGRVHIHQYSAGGKPFVLETLGEGEFLGTLCRLARSSRHYPCTAVAATTAILVRIPDKHFRACRKGEPRFVEALCGICSDRLVHVLDRRRLDQEPVAKRLAVTLIKLEEVHGSKIPLSKRELSEIIGAATETTFRALADLVSAGLVASSHGSISIKNHLELLARAYGAPKARRRRRAR